jgi:peptidyl-prolyl cis-trans isomerase D
MVAEFDAGILSVPPGGITGVVETQFGYHIIRRSTWAEAREQFSEAYPAMLTQKAESIYVTRLEDAANVQVRSAAPKVVKAIAEDIDAYRDDRTVLATSRRGNLSAARMAQWIAAFPPQSQMRPQIMDAPDSLIPRLVENIMRSELLLKQADSANIVLDSAELAGVRSSFFGGVTGVMRQLELAPEQLAGAGEDRAAREKAAAERVNTYLDGLLNNRGQYVEVPEQLAVVLRDKFESRVVTNALDRALA